MAMYGGVEYRVARTAVWDSDLTRTDELAIGRVIRDSAMRDLPAMTPEQAEALAGQAEQMRHRPNSLVGTPLLRPGQRFARLRSVVAVQAGEVLAHLSVADNVSSRKPGVYGVAERFAKLHLEGLGGKDWLGSRYAWLGYAALSPELRTSIQQNPASLSPLDVVMALALTTRKAPQPVSTFVYPTERPWKTALWQAGLRPEPVSGNEPAVPAYGVSGLMVREEHWTADSAGSVTAALLDKAGDDAAGLRDFVRSTIQYS